MSKYGKVYIYIYIKGLVLLSGALCQCPSRERNMVFGCYPLKRLVHYNLPVARFATFDAVLDLSYVSSSTWIVDSVSLTNIMNIDSTAVGRMSSACFACDDELLALQTTISNTGFYLNYKPRRHTHYCLKYQAVDAQRDTKREGKKERDKFAKRT